MNWPVSLIWLINVLHTGWLMRNFCALCGYFFKHILPHCTRLKTFNRCILQEWRNMSISSLNKPSGIVDWRNIPLNYLKRNARLWSFKVFIQFRLLILCVWFALNKVEVTSLVCNFFRLLRSLGLKYISLSSGYFSTCLYS